MAKHNPFSIFRRNQKAWMAGLTLFTMFSFIALGSMLQCVGTRNSGGEQRFVGDVAKTQKFGKLDYNTFLIIRQDLFRLQAFLQSLTQQAGALGAIPSAELAELNAEVTIAASDAEIIVDRWLIGKYADAMKLGADDSAALQYLQILIQVTQQEKNESVTRTLPSDAITNSMRAAGLNETSLKDLLKRQIAYQRVIREFDGGRRTVPEFYYTLMMAQYGMLQLSPAQLGYGYAGPQPSPSQILRGYEALNRLIKTRVVTFKAEDYVDLVSDPTEEEARAYYEQYKDVVFSSASNQPGFTQPTKLALQVVRADVTEEILNAITTEEVEKYYEEHKEDFRNPQHAAASAATEEAPAQETISLDNDAPSLDAIPEDALNALSDDVENAVDPAETAAENATEAVENAAQDAVDAAQDAAEEAVDSAADAVENAAEAVEDAVEPQSNYQVAEPNLMVYNEEAVQDDDVAAEEAPTEEPAAEEPVAEEPAAEEAPAEEPAAEEAPAEEPAAEEAPAEEPAAEEAPAEEPAAEEAPAEESAADDADAEYLSLASVEGFIRQRIASEAIDADLNDLNADLAQYYRATIKSDDGNVVEKDVDMAAFAEAHGFQYHMTHVLTDFNAEQPDAFSFEQALIADLLPVNTLQEIYSSAPMPYSPQRAVNGSTMYVFRAIEVIPQTRPEFEDCKDFVVEQWKLRQAVKIAQKNADELLAKIQGGEDFDQAAEAAQATVVETEKFTWMRSSLGPYNPMPQLSEVCEAGVEPGQANRDNKEIVAPGWAFFELAYSLGQDGVGQCLNQAEDRVFVVKVVDNGDDELISEVFEKLDSESSARFAAMQIQRYEFERYHEDLVKSLRDSSGFQWIWLPHVDAER